MSTIKYQSKSLTLEAGETVLDGLNRHGIAHPFSCRTGICQSCIMKVTAGSVPAKSQAGLKQAYRDQGYFLPCVCEPSEDITVDECGAVGSFPARIVHVRPLSERVMQVMVDVQAQNAEDGEAFDFSAGQFISLVRDDGLTRPYSIANLPGEGLLELHVALRPSGRMSQWLRGAEGTSLTIRGPSGECYYQADDSQQPLLLAGTGTGLSPLLGVLRDALAKGHQGPIHLYHGARTAEGLYMMQTLRTLEASHPQLRVVGTVMQNTTGESTLLEQPLEAAVLAGHPQLKGVRLYLCGNPELVRAMKKKAFLAGASLQQIHSDPFVTAPER